MANGAWQFSGADQGSEGQGGGWSGNTPSGDSGYQPGNGQFSWQYFQNLRSQIAERNAANNIQGPDYMAGYDGNPNVWRDYVNEYNRQYQEQKNEDRGPFSMSGGTKDLYKGKYRKANAADTLAIEALRAGDWWMNLPSNLAEMAGNEQLAKDLKFNPNEFDPSNGFDMTDAGALGKFALSVPGMIPGGLFEGAGKAYEAATGAPVQEYREKEGGGYEIADYNLDMNQRFASGLDAAIDVGGTFLGGSGKAISVAGKAIGRGLASRAADRAIAEFGDEALNGATRAIRNQAMDRIIEAGGQGERFARRAQRLGEATANAGRGIIDRAVDRAGFGAGMQFAGNVMEEAGEEFAQSYLEDFRNKSYDPNESLEKATTSAAWGALGGGLMHGAGAIGNRVIHGRYDEEHRNAANNDSDPQNAVQEAFSRNREFERTNQRNRGFEGTQWTDAVRREAEERIKDPDAIPASNSAFGTTFTNDLNLNQARASLDMLDGMCQMRDQGQSIRGLAECFHTTEERILQIAGTRNANLRLAAWQTLLRENGGKVTIYAGRNPDTNKIGVCKVDLVDIVLGGGVQLNANAWKMLGGDVDGDRYQTYFYSHSNVQNVGYLTRNLVDRSNNRSTLDDDYVKFIGDDTARDLFHDSLRRVNDELLGGVLGDNFIGKATRLFNESNMSNSNAIHAVSIFLDNLRNEIVRETRGMTDAEGNAISERQLYDNADMVIATLMHDVQMGVVETAQTFEEVIENLPKQSQEELDRITAVVEQDDRFLRSGNNKGKVHAADWMAYFGKRTGLSVGADLKGNSVMRQSAVYKFEAYEEQDVWFEDTLSHSDVQSRFRNLIAYSFALENIGEDVENSIENVFWVAVVDSTMSRMIRETGRTNITGNWDVFSKILVEEYNKKVDDFNSVLERDSTVYGMNVLIGSRKTKVDPNSQAGLAQVFHRAFGETNIGNIIAMDPSNPLYEMTFNQAIMYYALGVGKDYGPFSNIPGFGEFFKYVIEDYNSTFRATQTRYESVIEDFGEQLVAYGFTDVDQLIRVHRDDDGNVTGVEIIAEDFESLKMAIEAAHYIFGEKECFDLGIGTMEGFLTTEWGREWMSGDLHRMLNAVLSVKLNALYMNAINLFESRPDNWENDLELELSRLAQNSGGFLEYAILADWQEHHDLGLLRVLQDLDTTYLDKDSVIWSQIRQEIPGANSLLAELFATGNMEIGTSVFTRNLKNAKRSMLYASQRSNAINRETLNRVRDIPKSEMSDTRKLEAMKHFLNDAYVTASTNAMAAFVHSQRDVVKAMVDKGLSPTTSDIVYQIRQKMTQGGLFSSLEEIDLGMGSMSIGKFQANRVQICHVLSDPSITIRAYDQTRDSYCWISRDAIFDEILGEGHADPDLNWDVWCNLFEACPALVSLVTPTHIGVQTKDGKPSVNEGTRMPLDQALLRFEESAKTSNKEFQHVQHRNRAFQIAMSDPNWWAVVAAHPDIAESRSLAETKDIVESAITENLEWILAAASHDERSSVYQQRCALIGRLATAQMIEHVDNITKAASLSRFITDVLGSTSSALSSEMFNDSMRFILDVGISRALQQTGFRLDGNRLVPLTPDEQANPTQVFVSSLQQHIQEASNIAMQNATNAVQNTAVFGQDYLTMMLALVNMIDQDMFHYRDYMESIGAFQNLHEAIDQYEATPGSDPNVVNDIRQALSSFDNGGIGGFTNFVFGYDVMDLLSNGINSFGPNSNSTFVLTTSEVAEWGSNPTPENIADFKDAVHQLCDRFNFNESTSKIDSDIDRAFAIENVDQRIRRLNEIKNYFNQVIVDYSMKRMLPPDGVYNTLAPKQTVEAYRTMFDIADRVRRDIGHNLEPTTDALGELKLGYGNPVSSCMSQHMAMNAASGSIASGIGLDGSMLTLLGGLGLIDEMEPIEVDAADLDDFYLGWNYRTVDPNGNIVTGVFSRNQDIIALQGQDLIIEVWRDGFIGDSTDSLVNFIQEPAHLREKKSLGAIRAFSDPTQIDRDMYSDYSVDQVLSNPLNDGRFSQQPTAREIIQGAVRMRRRRIEQHLMRWYQSDEASDLHFGAPHAKMYANIMCQLIEVRVGNDEAAGVSGGVYYISASSLESEEEFLRRNYDFGYGIGVLPPRNNVSFRPVAMGIQEVSEKIIRNVCDHYYPLEEEGNPPHEDQILQWANDGMRDFDGYNSDPISIREFLRGIKPNPSMVDNPMLGDMNYSARTLWDDRKSGLLSATIGSDPDANTNRQMSNDAWNDVRGFNAELLRIEPANQQLNDFLKGHQIVSYSRGSSQPGTQDAVRTVSQKANRLPHDTGTALNTWDQESQHDYRLVEMFDGTSFDEVKQFYKRVSRRGRQVLIREDQARNLILSDSSATFDSLSNLVYQTITIEGVSYRLLDPSPRRALETYQKESLTLDITEMHPDEITTAMGSDKKLALPDAGSLQHPDVRTGKLYTNAVEVSPTKILKGGFGAVRLVTNLNEAANISMDDVDFSYYDQLKTDKDMSVYRDNAARYVNEMQRRLRDGESEMPRSLNGVERDECIGFIRQPRCDGTFVYAPIFYEGSVARVADSVVITQLRSGHIRFSFSSDRIDYGSPESQKMDYYGVAYKTVGTVATAEDLRSWAAITDGGFGLITRADFMFDGKSVASRLFELGDTILHNNMVFFTRKVGINAFYERTSNGWAIRQDLHPDIRERPDKIRALATGDVEAWANVGAQREGWHIYQDSNTNAQFARAVQNAQSLGVNWVNLLFCTARVIPDENGTPVYYGRERRHFDPHAIFKYWNTDDFLALWNHLDSRLCPANTRDDAGDCTFDRRGRMLDHNTISGQPERCVTFVGPNFYSGEGTAIADLSRSATYSNQHIIKRMLANGLYRRNIRGTIDALSVAVERLDHATRAGDTEEELAHWRNHVRPESVTVNQEVLERARMAIQDPLYLSLIDQRRQKLIDIAEEYHHEIDIVESVTNSSSAFDNKKHREAIENAVDKINDALGKPTKANALNLHEVMMLVRSKVGYTSAGGNGISSITFNQFIDAINQILSDIREHRRVVMGGRYRTRGDDRVSISLLPRGLVTRLAMTPLYIDEFGGDVDAILDDQYQNLVNATIPAIRNIENDAKRHALFQFADAMCVAVGRDQVSGHLFDGIYMHDVMEATRNFGMALQDSDPELIARYDEAVERNNEWANRVASGVRKQKSSRIDLGNGEYRVSFEGDNRTIVTFALRQLAASRRAMGLTYLEMPLSNMLDRAVGQTTQGWAYALGRRGIGPYRVADRMNDDIRTTCPKGEDIKKFWSALREAQMLGVDRDLLTHMYNGEDLDTAIAATIKEQGIIERISNKVMNAASGKDFGIEKQLQNFLDRFWQRSATEAPWWHQTLPGHNMTIFEERMLNDPVGLMIDLFSGSGEGKAADMILARQCLQQALAGDMAQKNLVSAFVGEVAKRSAGADFAITTLITPYFQYATNRMGKILNAVSPICTLHYLATQFFTEGPGGTMRIAPWSETTFAELGLDEVQVKQSLREAIFCDMCHMGGTLVAMMLAGMALNAAGILEPPDDEDKRGNFEEWTFFGMRINANWWIEDSLGIALPLACFWASAMRGEPRIDLMFNGITHYLGNNPVTKVADAAAVLFDPMAELYKEYDQDIEGYAKAMGGPPDVWRILNGKMTSFGLSYASQFITPGILREFYQAAQGNEVSYKRVFETDATGKLTLEARERNKQQYTTYEDAVIRKYTKDNPVMGFLADMIIHPETGYMNHEMPDRIIYDPSQMNSLHAFSMYEDPYTKKQPKSAEEQYATALMVIATLQSNSVEDLVQQGFMLDYDTKKVVGQVIWDMIATENEQWADLEQSGALSYYNAGYGSYDENVAVISQMREVHNNYIKTLKNLYSNKLWSDDLYSVTMYNQMNTEWAQDVNGNWYATGFAPTVGWPFIFAPGESPGEPQLVMSRENDWQTQSYVNGEPLGQRALIHVDQGRIEMPDKPSLNSYSTDGTSTGHSELFDKINGNNSNGNTNNKKNTYPRYGGGGGGYRRGGGGGGGYRSSSRSYTPNISAPNVSAPVSAGYVPKVSLPRLNASRIMDSDRLIQPNEDYLRPDFETKGSREAYKRSDI